MKIIAETDSLKFVIEFEGKYLNLVGDSATGKTSFYKVIDDYLNGINGIYVESDIELETLGRRANQSEILNTKGKLFVMDENCGLLRLDNIAEIIKKSNNYFIIISRKAMRFLPLSIDNVCVLDYENDRLRNKPIETRRTVNYVFNNIGLIITEDSDAGFEFFEVNYKVPVKSAKGNGNLLQLVKENLNNNLLVVYDAACGGSISRKFYRFVNRHKIQILDWESFEWYVLKCTPINICLTLKDSGCSYESLEQMATDVLRTEIVYNKNKLPLCLNYLQGCNGCDSSCKYNKYEFNCDLKINSINELRSISVF